MSCIGDQGNVLCCKWTFIPRLFDSALLVLTWLTWINTVHAHNLQGYDVAYVMTYDVASTLLANDVLTCEHQKPTPL